MKVTRMVFLCSLVLVLVSAVVSAQDYFDIATPLFQCRDISTNEVFYSVDENCPPPDGGNIGKSGVENMLGYIIDYNAQSVPGSAILLYQCKDDTPSPAVYYYHNDSSCPRGGQQFGDPLGYIIPTGGTLSVLENDLNGLGKIYRSEGIECDEGTIYPGDISSRNQDCTISAVEEVFVFNNLENGYREESYYAKRFIIDADLRFIHAKTGLTTGASGGAGTPGDSGRLGGTGGKGGQAYSQKGANGQQVRGCNPDPSSSSCPSSALHIGGRGGGGVILYAESITNNAKIDVGGENGQGGTYSGQWWLPGGGGAGGGAAGKIYLVTGKLIQGANTLLDARGGQGGQGQWVNDQRGQDEAGAGGGGGAGDGGIVWIIPTATITPSNLFFNNTGGARGPGGVSGAETNKYGSAGVAGNNGPALTNVPDPGLGENNQYLCSDGIDNDYDGDIDWNDDDCVAACPTGAVNPQLGCCGDEYNPTITDPNNHSPRYAGGDCGNVYNDGVREYACRADAQFVEFEYENGLVEPSNINWEIEDSVNEEGRMKTLGCDTVPVLSEGSRWAFCNDPAGFDNGDARKKNVTIGVENSEYICFRNEDRQKLAHCKGTHDPVPLNEENDGLGIYERLKGEYINTFLNDPGFELDPKQVILGSGNELIPYFWSTENFPTGHMYLANTVKRSGDWSFYADGARTTKQTFDVFSGRRYTATIWVYPVSGTAKLRLSDTQGDCEAEADTAIKDKWQLIGCSLDTNDNELTISLSTTGSGDIYFDDASVSVEYCRDDRTWGDLDNDEASCDASSEGTWAGSNCCGELDDFLGDGNRESYNSASGENACFQGRVVPATPQGENRRIWPSYEDGKLKANSVGTEHKEIINIGGQLRGCAIDETNSSGSWVGGGSNLDKAFFNTALETAKRRFPFGGSYKDDNDNDALLELGDCPNPGQDGCGNKDLIKDYGYCQTFFTGKDQYYCAYDETWKHTTIQGPYDGLKTFPWTKPEYDDWKNIQDPEYKDLIPAGCCAADSCWDGNFCQPSQHGKPNRESSYPGGRFCVNGEWIKQEAKLPWDKNVKREGYCERNDQCLVSKFGDYNNNDKPETFDSRYWGDQGEGPQCISAGQYIKDNYCEPILNSSGAVVNAKWTTRTKQIAGTFLDFLDRNGMKDYTVYCDTYDRTLNEVGYPPTEIVNESEFRKGSTTEQIYIKGENVYNIPPIGGQYLCGESSSDHCVNNFCVLRWDDNGVNKTAFGVSLNIPVDTSGHGFLKALGEDRAACDNVISGGGSEYQECNGGKFHNGELWFNNETNSVIFSLQKIDLGGNPPLTGILGFLAQYIPVIEMWASQVENHSSSFVSYDYAGNIERFSKFYESSITNPSGQIEKKVQSIKEEDVLDSGFRKNYIAARFSNFEGDFCDTVDALPLANPHSPNKFLCTKYGNDYEIIAEKGESGDVYDFWGEMTARLRLQRATPACVEDTQCNGFFNPLCPGNDPDYVMQSGDSCCRLKEIDQRGNKIYYLDKELLPNGKVWEDTDCGECRIDNDCSDGDSFTTDQCNAGVCSNTPISYCSGYVPDGACNKKICTLDYPDSPQLEFDVDCYPSNAITRLGDCEEGEGLLFKISDLDSGHLIDKGDYSVCYPDMVDAEVGPVGGLFGSRCGFLGGYYGPYIFQGGDPWCFKPKSFIWPQDDKPADPACSAGLEEIIYAEEGHVQTVDYYYPESWTVLQNNPYHQYDNVVCGAVESCTVKSSCTNQEVCVVQLSNNETSAHVSACDSVIQQDYRLCCEIN